MDITKLVTDSLKENGVLFYGLAESNDFTEEQKDFIKKFHTQKLEMIELDDDYLPNTGIRANHFVIELGYTEMPFDTDGPELDYSINYALITANHKGDRVISVVKIL